MGRYLLRVALFSGLACAATGLIWGTLFAGIPYQDPTPEQQASYTLHASFAGWLMLGGVVLTTLSAIGYGLRWLMGRRG